MTPDPRMEDVFSPGGKLRLELLSETAALAVQEAIRIAQDTRWDRVRSPHVFMGLLAHPDDSLRHWGNRLGADLSRLRDQFQELFQQEDGANGSVVMLHREFFSDNVIRLFREAQQRALHYRHAHITPMDLLISLLTAPQSIVTECFERIGVTAAKLTEFAVIAEQSISA